VSQQSFFSKVFRRQSLSNQPSICSSYSNSSFLSCALPPDQISLHNATTPQPMPDIGKYLLSQQSSSSSLNPSPFPGPHYNSSPIILKRRPGSLLSACSSTRSSVTADPRSNASSRSGSSMYASSPGSAMGHFPLSNQGSSISTKMLLEIPSRYTKSTSSSQGSLRANTLVRTLIS
jgi:hypothetical protein